MSVLGIDLRELRRPGTGIGRWTSNFLEQRARRGAGIEVVGFGAYSPSVDVSRAWPSPWALPKVLRDEKVTLWLSPYFKIPLNLPVPAIITVHDTIPATILHRKLSFSLRLKSALRRAAAVATVSDASKRDLIDNWNVHPSRIIMARNSVGKHFTPKKTAADAPFLRRWGLSEKGFLLTVSDDRPHKNLATLIKAFTGTSLPVVIVGTKRQDLPSPFLGIPVLDDTDLAILYRNTRALLHPALAEGFGLPPLEAMASGAPVIASDIPVMREIIGEGGRFVGALDDAAWRDAAAEPLPNHGVIEQAKKFRGEETYKALWDEI